jgi:threonine/homoserine/homoserine lactone efflux protein
MDLLTVLPAFLLAVLLISASPGPAMALILRRAALRGFRSTVPTVLGLELGIYLWALAAGAGVAALVAASQTLYLVIQITGAAFLIYLGVRSWAAVLRTRRLPETDTAADPATTPGPRTRRPAVAAFAEGLAVQIANPKAAVFMFAFYPQFIAPGAPVLATTAVLALVQVATETALFLALAAGVARAGTWFRRPVVRRRMEAITGTVLLALAGHMLLTPR